MPAGRPPKPIEQKQSLARGDGKTPGGREVDLRTPGQPQRRRTEPPAPTIPLGEHGVVAWERLWMAGWWLHDDEDIMWVEQIAEMVDELEAFRRRIAADGLIREGSQGQEIAHPLIGERAKLRASIQRALSELGFSPTARSRLNLVAVQTESKIQQMMNRNKGN